jgi:hypothetical protein
MLAGALFFYFPLEDHEAVVAAVLVLAAMAVALIKTRVPVTPPLTVEPAGVKEGS